MMMMLHLCRRVQLVPSVRAEFTLIDYFTVCVGPFSPHRHSPLHSFTDSLSTGCKQSRVLHCVSASFFIREWKWMSEHVVEEGGEVGLQLFMSVFSVWMSCTSMHLPVCVCAVCPSLCGPLRWGGGFATAVMNLVSVHRLPFHLGRQAGRLAGDHVLFLLSH